MTEKQIKQKFKETYPDFMCGDEPLSPYFDIWEYAIEITTKELQVKTVKRLRQHCNTIHSLVVEKDRQLEKARSIIHRLLVVIHKHKWWDYTVIDEAKAFMSEVDRDKDHD